MIGINTLS